ncbi:MAG: flavodoxin family protein [Candidatus Omnitrophica bacterium]|nr:flavodoxin family protein [Candidatus Omnitrophota bacterium]
MKVLLISASPHEQKSRTFLLAQGIVKGLAQEAIDTDTIHLAGCQIAFCRHCEACHKKMLNCSISDDAHNILRKMLEADGIILASPNYINQVTGSMKTLFDRSAHFIHCKRLLGKFVAGVVTSGSGQDEQVLDYIRFYGHTCGAQYSGGISCRNSEVESKEQEAALLGRKLAADIKSKKIYPEQNEIIEKSKLHFAAVMKLRRNDWQEEYKYWQDKGWL